ncbi:MAG: hypothetical protein K8J31_09785 [Anaerolineae bacterium]|nr:hypothetical protein [Anaerolineae bacterium]
MRACLVLMLLIFTACRPAAPAPTATPQALLLTEQVNILTPPAGAVIYSELIMISGTGVDLPGDAFALSLIDPDGKVISSTIVRGAAGPWSFELRQDYTGEPLEVTITARPLESGVGGDYAQRTIALAGLEYRPAGSFGRIDQPADESTVGGEILQVNGISSGIESDQILLQLTADNDQEISRQVIAAGNPYRLDEMPWAAEISTERYTGPATLQIKPYNPLDEGSITLASVRIMIDAAAG